MNAAELLLTQVEGENAVEEWVAKDRAVRSISLNRGYWDGIVPVLSEAALKKFIRLGGVIKVKNPNLPRIPGTFNDEQCTLALHIQGDMLDAGFVKVEEIES